MAINTIALALTGEGGFTLPGWNHAQTQRAYADSPCVPSRRNRADTRKVVGMTEAFNCRHRLTAVAACPIQMAKKTQPNLITDQQKQVDNLLGKKGLIGVRGDDRLTNRNLGSNVFSLQCCPSEWRMSMQEPPYILVREPASDF